MKNPNNNTFERFNLWAFYLAPLVLLAATIAKSLGDNSNFKAGTFSGVLTSFAFILFVFVMLQLTDHFSKTMPRFALVIRVLLVYSCFVGFTFGLDGALLVATREQYTFWTIAGAQIFPFSGLLWPIALTIAGVVAYSRKLLPPAIAGLLVLSGILFPAGRIPGNELLYYLSDIAFLVTFFSIARHLRAAGATPQTVLSTGGLREAI